MEIKIQKKIKKKEIYCGNLNLTRYNNTHNFLSNTHLDWEGINGEQNIDIIRIKYLEKQYKLAD